MMEKMLLLLFFATCTFSDLKWQKIPNVLTGIFFVLAALLIWSYRQCPAGWIPFAPFVLGMYTFLWYHGWLGGGDLKALLVASFLLSGEDFLRLFLLSSMVSLLIWFWMSIRRGHQVTAFPMFLSLFPSALVVVLWL